jgi:NADH-quinone oxidoreductase subunit N
MSAMAIAAAHLRGPHIDFAAFSPLLAFFGGAIAVLLGGLIGPRERSRRLVPPLALASLGTALGLAIWQWNAQRSIVAGALRIDDLSLVVNCILVAGGACATLLAWRPSRAGPAAVAASAVDAAAGSVAAAGDAGSSLEAGREGARAALGTVPEDTAHEEGRWVGELYALLLSSIAGMSVLASAQNTVVVFLGFELLSIPLYVLCAIERRSERSLEAGLKYLIIGSVGGATLLYGLALVYGATGATDFGAIAQAVQAHALGGNAMLLVGVGMCVAGFCFKCSVAPFHQWTPDVYEGAPTPITAFMAVATKVAALAAFLRLFDVALIGAQAEWAPAVAALAAITIVVGNVGALRQSSLKRLLAWSAVGQAGYMLAGVVVSTQLGVRATLFYLAGYLFMNLAAFAVVLARERETGLGDSIDALAGIGRTKPLLAWPMTLAMLGLAGIPGTVGFMGKFYLIDAAVGDGWIWLGIVIVVGSMLSLAYYLPVVAAIWMREAPATGYGARLATAAAPPAPATGAGGLPAIAGGSPDLDDPGRGPGGRGDAPDPPSAAGRGQPEVLLVALLAGAATLFFGIVPQPLFDLVQGAGRGLGIF